MKFNPNNFYHIFNRGNNRQSIFPHEVNYSFFRDKIKKSLEQHCDIVAYCLMPNHFHLLVYIQDDEVPMLSNNKMQILERKIGTLQSSYTRAINIQEKRTGSLFQPKCKVLELSNNHPFICFHYIHQNPIKAKLATNMNDWKYSSFQEYALDVEGICNKEIAHSFLANPLEKKQFQEQSKSVITFEYDESSDHSNDLTTKT